MYPFLVSNELLGDPSGLRQRARENGYLFFRGLIPQDDLLALRKRMLEICAKHGFLDESQPLMDGIAKPGLRYVESDPQYRAAYQDVQRLHAFHAMAHHPALIDMLGRVLDETVLVHPRNIARLMFPNNNQFTTPPHQDYVHIQGTEDTYTCWIPVGDCPRALGGLEMLAGSHGRGVLPAHGAYGAGGLGIDTEGLGLEWHGDDLACGDVLVFHSLCVHRAIDNTTPDRMRLSLDYRYQGASQPITQSSLEVHLGCLTWDEIYAEWPDGDLKYYWKEMPVQISEWTPRFHEEAMKQ